MQPIRRPSKRGTLRAVVVGALVAAGLLWSGPASAHVVFNGPDEGAAGSYVTTGLMVGHGCDGSPTTAVAVQIPDGVTSATPEAVPGWTAVTTMRTLEAPVEADQGDPITEAPATVTWTGGPLPDHEFTTFGLSLKLPDGEVGEKLTFPVVQTCEQGESAWIEVPQDGEDEPDRPAPQLTLTASTGGGHDGDGTEEAAAEIAVENASAVTDGSSSDGLAIVALGVGALGLVAGVAALALGRRRRALS